MVERLNLDKKKIFILSNFSLTTGGAILHFKGNLKILKFKNLKI
jgi:predicted outer membrane repeat protein